MMKPRTKRRVVAMLLAPVAWPIAAAMANLSDTDVHQPLTNYDAVVVEHADLVPFGTDGFAGYLTIWNGTGSEKIISSIDIEPIGKVELAKRVSADVVRSMPDTSVISVPPKSELHMDADTIFLMVNGTTRAERARVIVRFEDGSSTDTDGRFVDDMTSLTDHHHPSK